jgi:hypothetical protein
LVDLVWVRVVWGLTRFLSGWVVDFFWLNSKNNGNGLEFVVEKGLKVWVGLNVSGSFASLGMTALKTNNRTNNSYSSGNGNGFGVAR